MLINWHLLLLIKMKINDIVEKYVVKKIVYDDLFRKVNVTDTSNFVNKTDYNQRYSS